MDSSDEEGPEAILKAADEIKMIKKLPFKFTAQQIISQRKTSKENVEEIKNWLASATEKNIPSEIQDEMIVLFLLSCDNNVDLTKNTIISHYQIKRAVPDIFNQRKMDNEAVKKALKTLKLIYLPGRTNENYAVIYIRLRDTYYRNLDSIGVMKTTFMLMDIELEETPADGIIYLVDMKGFGFMHLTRIRLDPLRKYFAYLEQGLPMKFIGMHFLNANAVLDKFLAIIRAFLVPQLMDRLHQHQPNLPPEELYKIIPKKYIPKEMGGDSGPEEELCQETISLLHKKEHFWDVEEELRTQI